MSYTLCHLKKYVGGNSIDEKETVVFSASDGEFMWMLRLPRNMTQKEALSEIMRGVINRSSKPLPAEPKKYSLDYLQQTSISDTFKDGKRHLVILNSNACDFMWFLRFPMNMTQDEIISELMRTVGNLFRRHPKNAVDLKTALKKLQSKFLDK